MSEIINTLLRASVHHFIGRLGRDPEMRFLQNGNSVCNASIGINRPGARQGDGQEADWIKLEIWGEDGQRFADACRKGQEVHVVGRVKTDRWTDRNTGEERMALCCMVKRWELMASTSAPTPAAAAPAPAAAPAAAQAPAPAAPAQHPAYAAAGYQPAQPAAPAPQQWDSGDIPF